MMAYRHIYIPLEGFVVCEGDFQSIYIHNSRLLKSLENDILVNVSSLSRCSLMFIDVYEVNLAVPSSCGIRLCLKGSLEMTCYAWSVSVLLACSCLTSNMY